MKRREFLKKVSSRFFALSMPVMVIKEHKTMDFEEMVGDMDLNVKVNNEMVINFGKNRLNSSDLNGDDLWLPIDKNSFYGFTSVDKVDFDNDGIEDLVLGFEWGAYGSGFAFGNLVVSSKKRTAQFYKSFSGAGFWWIPGPIPEVKEPYNILEVRDWMPIYPEIKLKEGEFDLAHSESMGFIFTHVWNGKRFEFKAVPEFYQKLLPRVEEAVKIAEEEKEYNQFKLKMYNRIAEDFEKAASGEKISVDTLKSSGFKLLKEIEYK
ncbi:MAG TPA: hypothetical protein P5277_01210 [Candidatus Paceibacterota bacterium]|nr:hypothetical protein [Candidatus Paceibacterota bacterium]